PAEALGHLERAIRQDGFSPPLRYEKAEVLSQLGRHEEAATELEMACRLQPQSAEFHFKLGLAWADARKFDKAAEALETTVKLDVRHAQGWYNLGLARAALGQTAEGLAALSRAEALAPADPQIPYARAEILARNGRYAEARTAA